MFREKTSLVLGRGEVYFDRGDGERYLGNTPVFRIQREIQRIERSTAYRGRKQSRPGLVVQETMSASMTTDHMSNDNVAMWYGTETLDRVEGDAFVPYFEYITVRRNRFYQLGTAWNGVGLGHVDSAEVRLTNSTGTVLTSGLHYHLERDSGRIQIPANSPIADGVTLFVRYIKRPNAYKAAETSGQDVFGALRYIAKDPYGPKVDYWFPKVSITPRGAVDLKGDEFRQMSFDIDVFKNSPNQPLVYLTLDKQPPIPITADTALVRADTTLYRADNSPWQYEV